MASKSDSSRKPKPERPYQAKRRNCLMCQDSFESRWPGERVCKKCKATAGWRTG